MRFYADLHVHSKYSRATSSDCDLVHLAYWARRKGITVVGTGDFTHPAWMDELEARLVPAEPGLYRLRDDAEKAVGDQLEAACQGATRFMLSVEISTIYKKGDRTRKIHHLVYAPDFEAAKRLTRALSKIGNLHSDGRPILGLDSRHLLEMVLESGEGSYLVPAHIWTPWFSVLGSKAGFDAVDECYGDLARHVFALETGLSSDPAMNWRLSALDRYRLVSNSDAHSPGKLGREATAFDTPIDYFAIRRALETGEGFAGTVEFFPEEGKYHLDGHRKCNVRMEPQETRAHGERCPACGQPMTVGVLSRVEELADREEGARPEVAPPFTNLVPLPEVLAEIHETGASSKAVDKSYRSLLARLGPELFILEAAPVEDIERASSSLVAEAIGRMREGRVIRDAGYDGEYGVIRLFAPEELRRKTSAGLLFDEAPAAAAPAPAKVKSKGATKKEGELDLFAAAAKKASAVEAAEPIAPPKEPEGSQILAALDADQRAAAAIIEGPLLIIAGPGTGKTRTLTHRVAHLVADRGVAPEACLAITFTRRAAEELRERLHALLGEAGERVPAMTFHSLGLAILQEFGPPDLGLANDPAAPAFTLADEGRRVALLAESMGLAERKAERLVAEISRLKRQSPRRATKHLLPEGALADDSELDRAWAAYEALLDRHRLWDFDDLVGLAALLLEQRDDVRAALHDRWRHLSIDEYQDVDERQYRLARLLVSPAEGSSVCAIGDPDQAIYGFRGADVRFFFRFREDFPAAKQVRIAQNYRSTRAIVDAALGVIAPSPTLDERRLIPRIEDPNRIVIHDAASERAEAEFVVHTIEKMIGGSSFFSRDSGRVSSRSGSDLSFSDFAILYRTDAQADAIVEALARSGMPFSRRAHGRLAERAAVTALVQAIMTTPATRPLPARLEEASARLREEIAAPAAEGEPALREADVDAARELLQPIAERFRNDPGCFFVEVATEVEIDTLDPRADRVTLLTLHASKGLEFRVVFLIGCEDGLLPLRFGHDDGDLDEERRLFYVGITRARERLFLTHARERTRRGKRDKSEVSPFVRDIAERLLERRREEHAKKPADRQLKLF